MDLNFKVEGNGKTLVLIHGLSDNLLYWEFLASNLKKDYQVIRIDLRGHGESELDDDEITADSYVEDLNDILDDLNISNVNLIGFSLGGAIAIDYVLKYPHKVDSLVMMSSFIKTDNHLKNIFTQFKNSLNIGFEEFYDLILPMVLCPEVISQNREELDMLREIASITANTEAYIKAIDAFIDFNVENELSKVHVPTLILAGKYDDITLLDSQKQLQCQIKNSEMVVFENVKHNLLVGKNNEKILSSLKKFYKKIEIK
ncbi:alpha/beta fold hydrolase [Methanobrevibacter sp.]|uniref:alpha/beta fold hydrolase n=1 Tax=Methanobrevibacter sp. TaxID=66852 RepID=UPI00386D901A